jgi:ferredoxin-like protein FixX
MTEPGCNSIHLDGELYCEEHSERVIEEESVEERSMEESEEIGIPTLAQVKKGCQGDGCTIKNPAFNYTGNKKGLYCSAHKEKDMINVKDRTCLECGTRPNFNYEGQSQGIYCTIHKKPNMINVKDRTCLECGTRPNYNYEGQSTGIYCANHKKPNMINVKVRTCLEECGTQPYFNYEGQTKGIYCAIHKKPNMINVKDRTCLECGTRPYFNYEGQTKGIYCAIHKKPNMIDVKNTICKTPLCGTHVQKKYKGYCLRCFIYNFPNEKVSRNYKTREKYCADYIIIKLQDPNFIRDKTIDGACSKRRPDMFKDLLTHVIVFEIDENQHKSYDYSCDNRRMMELSKDIAHRPLVLIRFNPDSYTDKNGNKIKSTFTVNKLGVCVVNKKMEKNLIERLDTAVNTIKYHMEHVPEKTITPVELFFDGY